MMRLVRAGTRVRTGSRLPAFRPARGLPPAVRGNRAQPKLPQPRFQRTNTTVAGDTANVNSVNSAEELARFRNAAEEHLADADVQAAYLRKLNASGKASEVLLHCERFPQLARNDSVTREMVRALFDTGKAETVSLEHVLALGKGLPAGATSAGGGAGAAEFGVMQRAGASASNPIHVQNVQSKWQLVANGLYLLFFGALVYMMFFRGGNSGIGGLLGDQKEYTAVESHVKTRFSDVRGSDEAKEALEEMVDYLRNPQRYSKLGAKLPKGVLLTGPPGCGKTLLARAVAGEADVPFFFASGSEFEEMFVGVGARRVRTLFKKAKENAPCIVFLDEIDAVGGRRDMTENRTKMTLNQLLVELDGFAENSGVLVIAATNLPGVLDPALIRPGRFDKQVLVDLPDVKARRSMLDLYVGSGAAQDVDLDSLARATVGFSGADIANMVNLAKIEGAKEKLTKITTRLLDHARETIMMGPARKHMIITPATKRLTAYHEGGHALVALLSKAAADREIVKATLVPRGHALGMVSYLPKDELMKTKEAMLADLDVAMGGRVAEEMIFGPDKITQGASSDFDSATQLARRLVMQYGMSEKVGPVVISKEAWKDASSELKILVEQEVRRLLDESYARAKHLLETNEKQLHLLAEALLEHETLTREDIEMVVAGKDVSARINAQKARDALLAEEEREQLGEKPESVPIEDEDDDDEDEGTKVPIVRGGRRAQPSALR